MVETIGCYLLLALFIFLAINGLYDLYFKKPSKDDMKFKNKPRHWQ